MRNHAYIELIVTDQLEKNSARKWLEIAKSVLPEGITAETEIRVGGNPKLTSFYNFAKNGKIHYVIPLARDPNLTEVQAVATAWDKEYPDGDFEIDYSTSGTAMAITKEVQSTSLKEIAFEAAKLNHNEWMKTMNESGWSYGIKFDQKNKRNPIMRPWEELSKHYRYQELQRFQKLMEVLERMNLRLIRKKS